MYPPTPLLPCPPPPFLSFSPSFCLSLSLSPRSISVPVLLLAMCGLTDEPLFAVLSYLSGGWGGGVGWGGAMCLEWLLSSSPWPSERAGSAAGHALAEADAAYELETSWRSSEAVHDTWMNLKKQKKNPGTLQGHSGCCFLFLFFCFFILQFAEASFLVGKRMKTVAV